ncbi:MAG: MFS transporter [Hyphomicrobiaceae bacterium]
MAKRLSDIPAGIWALGLVSMLMDISSEMIHALLPLYMVGVLGTSALAVGLIEGIAEATAAITKVFSGALSDRIGRRKEIAALGYGLSAATKPVFALATGLGWLVGARFLDRVGKGIRGAPRDALVADLSPPDLRGASFGLRQALDTTGAFLGPLLAILLMLATGDNYVTVFWVAVVPGSLAFLLIVLAVKEPEQAARSRRGGSPISRAELSRLGRPYWVVTGIAALFTLARFSEAFLILKSQAVGLPVALAPLVMVAMNVVYALSAYPAGALSDRIGRLGLLGAGLALLVAADLVLAVADGVAAGAVGVALWGLHMGMTQGLISALVADVAPAALRGTAFGVLNLVTGVALLAASVIAGALWAEAGPASTFIAGAGFAVLSAVALLAARGTIGQVRSG